MEVREVSVQKVNKAKKRRRKKIRAVVFAVSFLVVLAITLWVLAYTVLFPIDNITVAGNSLYTAEDIINDSGIEIGDKLYGISQKNTENILTHRLPYIKTIEFERSALPDATLKIIVNETSDVFCYQSGEKFITADADNKALASFFSQPENTTLIKVAKLPEIKIGDTVQLVGENEFVTVRSIYDVMSENGISVKYIDITSGGAEILINNRFIVDFGGISNLEGKVAHLVGMLEKIDQKNGKEATGRIDLSAWTNKNQYGYLELTDIS